MSQRVARAPRLFIRERVRAPGRSRTRARIRTHTRVRSRRSDANEPASLESLIIAENAGKSSSFAYKAKSCF